jgi:hypothetical protein
MTPTDGTYIMPPPMPTPAPYATQRKAIELAVAANASPVAMTRLPARTTSLGPNLSARKPAPKPVENHTHSQTAKISEIANRSAPNSREKESKKAEKE